MPKRSDINTILIIGSGPIIIGQACEFDYSGTQACKALRALGYKIILVNSNPATIMTDTEMADITYIEPLNLERLTQIIEKERPDAILPNLGGQSGLNLCLELEKAGVLSRFGVQVIGVKTDAIERGEDRIEFKEAMKKLGIETPRSEPAYSVEEALAIADKLGYPVVVRPAYTMGGAGGGIVNNPEELATVAGRGISASLIGQALIEECILGWEELELEVVRDSKNQMITVCFIENIDPIGVHTGDSFCCAPMLTTPKSLQNRLQEMAYKIVESIEVIGGTNVQFAHDPVSDRIVVIEINPRTSRSSALASKATGFPIALISAMLACGLTLDEIPYWKEGTLEKYVPSGDYVVIKFARWAFEKFRGSEDKLGTQMRAVGEVMSIGKTYKEAFQKAVRSLESGRYGLGCIEKFEKKSLDELMEMLNAASSERQFIMYEALKKGADVERLFELTKINKYFLTQMKELVEEEKAIVENGLDDAALRQAKLNGFSDRYLAKLTGVAEGEIRDRRKALGVCAGWEAVPVSGVENEAYYFSTYNAADTSPAASDNKKIMILGSGPNRIGQGIEFDYCCVHAALALRAAGFETIMINCNPETVSTDYDTSDKLYFEPLTTEDVLAIYEKEKPMGLIAQFGGQTPLNLSAELEKLGAHVLGTSPDSIDLAEDRDRFREIMDELEIPMPTSAMASTIEQALEAAVKIGYPLMVRPSYVLGGRGMEVVHDDDSLKQYMANAVGVTPDRPILIDRFLDNAMEMEADAISDGTNVFVPAVMEHIEQAGIHSGDSSCIVPSLNIPQKHIETIKSYTEKIAKALKVCGLMNMQYAIADDTVYVLEANPRASRTVPLVSKVCNINMVRTATNIIVDRLLGKEYDFSQLKHKKINHCGVKEAVFPFNMFPEVDPVLGPEMRSTGEVLGISEDFGKAFFKAQEATQSKLPLYGSVFISVNDHDKEAAVEVAKEFSALGFDIITTEGTGKYFNDRGIYTRVIKKLYEGSPNALDLASSGKMDIVINTPYGKKGAADDSYIRKAAIKHRLFYLTTIAAARAAIEAIKAGREGNISVKPLQSYHSEII